MGTLAPVVDFLTAVKVRSAIMGVSYNTTVVNNWLSAFGYLPTDPIWIDFSPSTKIAMTNHSALAESTTIRIAVLNNRSIPSTVELSAPFRNKPVSILIYDLRGRSIRDITVPSSDNNLVSWNGLGGPADRPLPAGIYTVKCTMGSWMKTAMIRLP
jgi:hypothetical protein